MRNEILLTGEPEADLRLQTNNNNVCGNLAPPPDDVS